MAFRNLTVIVLALTWHWAPGFVSGHAPIDERIAALTEQIKASPDDPHLYLKRGELHRTRLLAKELSLLTEIPVREYLTLTSPISKRTGGFSSPARFEEAYAARLEVASAASRAESLLLVDDVITHGSTLAMAVLALRAVNPGVSITLVTAGIMILKDTVLVEGALIA